jgi:hypothetical protein
LVSLLMYAVLWHSSWLKRFAVSGENIIVAVVSPHYLCSHRSMIVLVLARSC